MGQLLLVALGPFTPGTDSAMAGAVEVLVTEVLLDTQRATSNGTCPRHLAVLAFGPLTPAANVTWATFGFLHVFETLQTVGRSTHPAGALSFTILAHRPRLPGSSATLECITAVTSFMELVLAVTSRVTSDSATTRTNVLRNLGPIVPFTDFAALANIGSAVAQLTEVVLLMTSEVAGHRSCTVLHLAIALAPCRPWLDHAGQRLHIGGTVDDADGGEFLLAI